MLQHALVLWLCSVGCVMRPTCKVRKRKPLTQIHRRPYKKGRITKNQGDITAPEDTNPAPVADPKEVEIYELPDKEPRTVLL